MKIGLLVLVVLLPLAGAISSTLTASPSTATVGEAVVFSYTKTATLSDGLQNGTVTAHLTGPTNTTLPSRTYHLLPTLTVTATATLTWTWTPTEAGTYTLTVTDTPTQGTRSNQTQTYHVEDTGGGGTVVRQAPLRVEVGLVVLAVGVFLVAFALPRTARRRLIRILGIILVAVAAILFLAYWW